jgi:protease-4
MQSYQTPPPRSHGSGFFRSCFFGLLVVFFGVGLIGLMFVMLGVMFAGISGGLSTIADENLTEKVVSGNRESENKIAILQIEDMILEDTDGFIVKQIKQITKDEDIQAVVLRVNSPGGTVSGSDYYWYRLRKMKEETNVPLVVSMGPIAASGGYYVSMAGDEIFAERSTITGSIGVVVPTFNIAGLMDKIGVESESITSGPLKDMGSPFRPLGEKEREIIQNRVDEDLKQFKEVIRQGRPEFEENPEKLDALATGETFSGREAAENGLVDRIGFQEDAVARAAELANLAENDYKVIRYSGIPSLAQAIFGEVHSSRSLEVEVVDEMFSAQHWYLEPQTLPIRIGNAN